MQPIIMLSPVGTSLLTNSADDQTRTLLNRCANMREAELNDDERDRIRQRAAEVRPRLLDGDVEAQRRASAEINGIITYYLSRSRQADARDVHALVVTDTYEGSTCADMVECYLRNVRSQAVVVRLQPTDLSTRDRFCFARGMAHVVEWCADTLPAYREQGYRVVFNLTGGFKSVVAYLNTLGMLYADEITYLFEPPSVELITIPRLPIRLDAEEAVRQHAVTLALLAEALLMDRNETAGIPELFLDEDEQGRVTISTWGLAIWRQYRRKLFEERLLEWPHLRYASSFRQDFERYRELRECLQCALAKVSGLLREHPGDLAVLGRDGGLQYETYARCAPVGHFRISEGDRVSCEPCDDGLLLRHFGPHDYVNRNL